jgi:hypothetical protein
MTLESLPIEYSITGLRISATTSRMMWMDSASSRRRWAGNTLGIEGFLDKARYLSGLQAEGNDLSYIGKLLLETRAHGLYFLAADAD